MLKYAFSNKQTFYKKNQVMCQENFGWGFILLDFYDPPKIFDGDLFSGLRYFVNF